MTKISDMEFEIEKATLKDTKALSRLECNCYGHSWQVYANYFWKRAVDCMWAYKATKNGKIIGGIVALPTRQKTVYVDTVFVAKKFRRHGVGEALMKKVLAETSGRKIQLDTWSYNDAAKNLFVKFGFKKKRILRNYYDEKIDYIFLERKLD